MPIKPTSEITVEVRRISPDAIQVDNGLENADGSERLVWLPKSEIQNLDELAFETGDTIEVILPDWLVENENLM
jgi:hypothetical protein